MYFEDEEPKKSVNFTIGEDLSKFSVDELSELIRTLEEEKARVQAEMDRKKKSLAGAESIFK